MSISTQQILKVLYVLSWIIFVGIGIQAGGFISHLFYTMMINPAGARNFWQGNDLSALYTHDRGYFLIETSLMSFVALLKACIFYLIIKIIHEKKLDLSQPFNKATGRFVFSAAYLSLLTGVFSLWGAKYAGWFEQKGVPMPDMENLNLDGGDVWLFMGVTLYVIAQIFKRGIEIQAENDLTV